jgi:penicillin G amidase
MTTTMSDVARPTTRPGWWRTFRGWPRPFRWTLLVAVTVVLLLVGGLITGLTFARRPFPQTSGTITVDGLDGEVEVIRDDHGIPQIYADSTRDLMMAQGFVHAQERFFEMDVRRHVTAGRLSELFGEDTLDVDKIVRTMGWRRVAEQELALLRPETSAALEAYAAGVNAYLEDRRMSRLGLQYSFLRASGLRYVPEKWTPVDSLAWLKAMAWDLMGNIDEEAARVGYGVEHSPDQVEQLFPAYSYADRRPIVAGRVTKRTFVASAGSDPDTSATQPRYPPKQSAGVSRASRALARIPALLGEGNAIGSNSWVVDGDHSATGQPILANDPHLSTSIPGIWFQLGLHCRTVSADCPYDVAGFTFSGVPGVIIGHNADISWGFTNLGPDVADLFLEKVEGKEWRYAGKLRPLRIRDETIRVQGGDDFDLSIRETDHGPLISDVSPEFSTVGANAPVATRAGGEIDRDNGFAVALSWTALTPEPTADAILGFNLASDWAEFRAAAKDFAVPAQNLVYADTEGHIGYQAPGRVPIRGRGNDGRTPAEGWLRENDWTGEYVPFSALPQVLDPEQGFLVTANNAVTGAGYQYDLTTDWDQGYRAQRIREALADEQELSVAEMARLQLDELNPMAPTLVPYLLDVDGLTTAYDRDGPELLRDWDYRVSADSPAAAFYNVTWANVLRLTFHDELTEDWWPDGGDRWFAVITELLARPGDPWWDDAGTDDMVETRDDILRQAMKDARNELTAKIAVDSSKWTWGQLHELNLREGTLGSAGIGVLERIFNRGGYRVGGGSSVVNATGWDAAAGYEVMSAPSMRMVVSLEDFDDSRWINLTGVSGHPLNDHYVDQTELYVAGRTLPWEFSRQAVTDRRAETLRLTPG